MNNKEYLKIYDLSGKVAIVTGGSSGIGRATALSLAKHGSNIVVVDLDPDGAEKVVNEIKNIDCQALYIRADVTNYRENEKVAEVTVDKFGKIDILVNCAGILSSNKIMETTEEDWDKIMSINLKGYFLCSKSVVPNMIKQKSGKIINIGSASSKGAILNMPQGGGDYCISKAGVHALTRALAWELAPYGINVNTVAPGPVETPMHKNRIEVLREKYKGKIPAGRLGEPQDIANIVAFLSTDAANYIIGQAIHVNGGFLMAD